MKPKYEISIAKSTLPKDVDLTELTLGKWYPVFSRSFNLVSIDDDTGSRILCLLKGCAHLYTGNWKIRKIKEETKLQKLKRR